MYKIWDSASIYPSLSKEEAIKVFELQDKGRKGIITQEEIDYVNALIEKDEKACKPTLSIEELRKLEIKEMNEIKTEMEKKKMESVKIISYNIQSYTEEKLAKLLSQEADVYVIPEIATNEKIEIPNEYVNVYEIERIWNNKHPTKGLGIIWKKGNGHYIPDWKNKELTFAIPLIYNNIFILGFWPTKIEKKTYTKIAEEIIDYYSPYFNSYEQCIITGDFNLFHNKLNKASDIITINKKLNDHNLLSVFHTKYNKAFGKEEQATYFHKPLHDKPYFLDYTYTKKPVYDYELMEWDKDFSDHRGQIIYI